ncbi:MAG: transcriptional regulator [Euryarchaeota archaeon]|nr:transcriptional regulator [Euryarchaeota archaeon]
MTRRDEIARELELRERSIRELAVLFGCSEREVMQDLRHVMRSVRARGRRMYVLPAVCLRCGTEIRSSRIRNVRKCPKCRSTHVEPPRFCIR